MAHYRETPNLKEKEAFERYLTKNEDLVLVANFSGFYLAGEFLKKLLYPGWIFLILGLFLAQLSGFNLKYGFLIGLVFAIVYGIFKIFLSYQGNRYVLTTTRILIKKGLLAVNLVSVTYDKITNIKLKQSFLDHHLLRHGSIIVNTSGASNNEVRLEYIAHPVEFKNLLEGLINREREHYGKPTGSISAIEGEIIED